MRYGYDAEEVAQLLNPLDAPVVFGHCCLTGSFELNDCFAEEWLKTTARRITYIGASDNTLWDEDDILERREVEHMQASGGSSVGETLDQGLRQTAAAYPATAEYYFTIYHVFGDPTIRMLPVSLSLEHTPLTDTADSVGARGMGVVVAVVPRLMPVKPAANTAAS